MKKRSLRFLVKDLNYLLYTYLLFKKVLIRHKILACYLGYFLSGFSVACWAPLIPYVQQTLALDHLDVAKLVLCFGIGSVTGMIVAGIATAKIGSKLTIAISSFFTSAAIFVLAFIINYEIEVIALIIFGISVGCLEVAVSVYGAYLERTLKLRIMTPLHAAYSLGEVCGAFLVILLLTLHFSPTFAITSLITILYLISIFYIKVIGRITQKGGKVKSFAFPKSPVIEISIIVAFTFIVGGAVIDWSGLFMVEVGKIDIKYASLGYMLVSCAMLTGRLYGRKIVRLLGPLWTPLLGTFLMASALILIVLYPYLYVILPCFVIIGLGMSNVSPLCISATSKQNAMPLVPAVTTVSIAGYTGLLCAPAIFGVIAETFSLSAIFATLAITTCLSFLLIVKVRKSFLKI